jgi:hypothetical protein
MTTSPSLLSSTAMSRTRPSSRTVQLAAITLVCLCTSPATAQVNSTNLAGANNTINPASLNVFIGAGQSNSVFGTNAAIVAGFGNTLASGARNGFIGAGQLNTIQAPVNFSFIGAGNNNAVQSGANNSAIVAGIQNTVRGAAARSVIVGGYGNVIGSNNRSATIAGGEFNTITDSANTNAIFALMATIGGGATNVIGAEAQGATIAGGRVNTASGVDATVGGGFDNVASGSGATVPGGINNAASGTNSFAAGTRAIASHNYSFVWGGSPVVDTTSNTNGSYTARAPGGFRLLTSTNDLAGQQLTAGGSSWATLSDSNAKTDIQTVDHRQTLARLASLPVSRWRYKHDPTREYIGPMAQDFHEAFGLGNDNRYITTLDTDGVTLSAIKGLVEELHEQDEALSAREQQIEDLEKQVKALRAQVGL